MGPAIPAATMSDPLPGSVPCLKPSGVNWAIFSMRFKEAMKANTKWGHFTGSIAHPIPVNINAPTDAEKAMMAAWDQDEVVTHYLLSQRLPNSTAVRLKALTSVVDRWNKIKLEFSIKSQYAKTNLLTAFTEMRCPRGGDVQSFLSQMQVRHEELAAVGVTMMEKDYQSAIIKALLEEM